MINLAEDIHRVMSNTTHSMVCWLLPDVWRRLPKVASLSGLHTPLVPPNGGFSFWRGGAVCTCGGGDVALCTVHNVHRMRIPYV